MIKTQIEELQGTGCLSSPVPAGGWTVRVPASSPSTLPVQYQRWAVLEVVEPSPAPSAYLEVATPHCCLGELRSLNTGKSRC